MKIGFYFFLFLLPMICIGQDDFHGRKYVAQYPAAKGSPFLNNATIVGNITWFDLVYHNTKYYYELVNDAIVMRRTIDNITYLIELPSEHVDEFSFENSWFVNANNWTDDKSMAENCPESFVETLVETELFEVYLKHKLGISQFTNRTEYILVFEPWLWLNNRWWAASSKNEIQKIGAILNFNLDNYSKTHPKIKNYGLEDWKALWTEIANVR